MARTDLSKNKSRTLQEEIDLSLNDVLLRGRVSAEGIEKELPSGDKVCEFRIVITRSEREGVDAIDVAAWTAGLRKRSLSLKRDEWVEVTGSIRRRFWQSPNGLASRWQVEANDITRL